MNNKREFKNIKEFKQKLLDMQTELSYYHDNMYEAGDDERLRGVYFNKMTQLKAAIDALKIEYPEYVL